MTKDFQMKQNTSEALNGAGGGRGGSQRDGPADVKTKYGKQISDKCLREWVRLQSKAKIKDKEYLKNLVVVKSF